MVDGLLEAMGFVPDDIGGGGCPYMYGGTGWRGGSDLD